MTEPNLEGFLKDLEDLPCIDRATLKVSHVPTKDGSHPRVEARYTGRKPIPEIRTDREAIPYKEDIDKKREFAKTIFGFAANLTDGQFSDINRFYLETGISARYSDKNLKDVEVVFY